MNKSTQLSLDFMSNNMQKYVAQNNFWYASAGKNRWMDGNLQIHNINSMRKDYIENCIGKVERDIDMLESGQYDSQIKVHFKYEIRKADTFGELKGARITVDTEALKDIKEELIAFLNEKKEELEEYM